MHPNKQIVCEDVTKDIREIQMSDIYPSMWQAQSFITQLAEKRVGMNELSSPSGGNTGSRTPGITALSFMQQANKRFAPAFDGMRTAISKAVRQCLYRYQEALTRGSALMEKHITSILGEEDAALVIDTLAHNEFDEQVEIELTAASSSINSEADKQNALMLANVLSSYYEKVLSLVSMASDPQTPPAVKDAATKIIESSGELIDRTIRTFDSVRDPSTFIIDTDGLMDQPPPENPMMDLISQMSGGGLETPQQAPPDPNAILEGIE